MKCPCTDEIRVVSADTQPALEVECEGLDVTGFTITLHLNYRPTPLVKPATITDGPAGKFQFEWNTKQLTTLDADVLAGATAIQVPTADFALLPETGDISLEVYPCGKFAEQLRYSSKESPDTLHLTSGVAYDHLAGAPVRLLEDLRPGKWTAEIQMVDAGGGITTIGGLFFNITPEIA